MSYLVNINTNFSNDKKSDKSSSPNTFSNNLIVQDLDSFFKNIYDYYYYRGYSSVFTQTILDNISYLFSIHFFILNIFIIDWTKIIQLCTEEEKCDLEISEFLSSNKFHNYFLSFVLIYTLLISYYFLFLWKSLLFLYKMKKVKFIYDHKLRIKQKEMENFKFDQIIERLIDLQQTDNYCRIKQHLTKFDIISRILRKENFIIAMITNNIVDLKFKIPFFGEKFFLTNYLYNNLYDCILKFAFEKGETKVNQRLLNLTLLRLKMLIFLIIEMIFIPATIFFKITFWIFRNADSITAKSNSTNFSQKIWAGHSQILFRNYNELQHHFEYRINKSYEPVEKFVNCFKDRRVSIVSKFFLIIGGSFFIIIFIISSIDNRLLTELKIFNKKVMWFAFVIGIIFSIFSANANYNRNSEEDFLENYQYKEGLYKNIINKIMNVPTDWRKSGNFSTLFKKISENYELSVISLLKEIFSILLFPFVWIKLIFKDTKNVIKFFKFYVKDVTGIGIIYSYSYFDISNFKFFKERDLNFNEWTFNDRKFLNSLIAYNNNFHSEWKVNKETKFEGNLLSDDPEDFDITEDEIMQNQCKIIEEKLLEIYKKENEGVESNNGSSITRVTINKNESNNDSEYLFKSFIHYHISQLNINEIMSPNEKNDNTEYKILTINDTI